MVNCPTLKKCTFSLSVLKGHFSEKPSLISELSLLPRSLIFSFDFHPVFYPSMIPSFKAVIFYESQENLLPMEDKYVSTTQRNPSFHKQKATSFHSELPKLAPIQSYHSWYSTNCQQSCKITRSRVSPIRHHKRRWEK